MGEKKKEKLKLRGGNPHAVQGIRHSPLSGERKTRGGSLQWLRPLLLSPCPERSEDWSPGGSATGLRSSGMKKRREEWGGEDEAAGLSG